MKMKIKITKTAKYKNKNEKYKNKNEFKPFITLKKVKLIISDIIKKSWVQDDGWFKWPLKKMYIIKQTIYYYYC